MKRYAQVFKNRTFPLVTLFILLAVVLGYFLFYVRGREVYFTQRYLRLLAFESGRIEERLNTLQSIFANYQLDHTLPLEKLKSFSKVERLDPPPPDFQVAGEGITQEGRIEGDKFLIYAGWKEEEGTLAETRRRSKNGTGSSGNLVVYRFDPFKLAEPDPPPDFETLFVAQRDGTVLFQKGQNRGRELRIVNVRRFLDQQGNPLDLDSFAQSSSILDVRFAGAPYKLFLRPCCRGIWGPKASERSLEWIVGGAVRSATLSKRTWSISFTIGIMSIGLFVLALLCLPFLRVLAIGAQEKLRVADALSIGLTSIVGVGLLTLLLLDLHAYQALTDRIDGNLQALADKVDVQMKKELAAAKGQFDALNAEAERQIGKALSGAASCADIADSTAVHRPGLLRPREEFIWQRPALSHGYMDFERFTWTDSKKQQCFKWSLGEVPDPLVRDIKDRRYFQEAMSGRLSLEPVFSTATGSRVLVMAKKIEGSRKPFVGVLGIEMSSLNQPVLPQGYGFAVIDDSGDVLFASEPRRAGYENFFEEVDNDRELRALVYARREDSLGTSYMGQGYRLRVRPIAPLGSPGHPQGPPFWTLIAFSDKGEKRALNVDLMTTAMLFLILYVAMYMAGCGFLRAANRRYRAGWLWPEKKGEERERIHLWLTVFYVLCLIASVYAIHLLEGVDLLWFAFLFPWAVLFVSYRLCAGSITEKRKSFLAACLGFALLLIYGAPWSGRPLDPTLLGLTPRDWPRGVFLAAVSLGLWGFFRLSSKLLRVGPRPPRWIYLAAASLLLTVTAAMPAAAFFYVSHRAHLEACIKRGQLDLARSREARDERLRKGYASFDVPQKTAAGQTSPLLTIVDDRVKKVAWDLYPDFFFSTAFQQVDAEPATSSPEQPQLAKAILSPAVPTGLPSSDLKRWEPCMLPKVFEQILPLYNDDFVRVRRLIADQKGDAWSWEHGSSVKQLDLVWGSSPPLRIRSTIPTVSLQGAPVLWPASVLLLGGVLIGVARFVAHKFFLFGQPKPDVVDAKSMAAASNQNFFLVSSHIDDLAVHLDQKGAAKIDLSKLASREDFLARLEDADLVSSPRIYLHHFEHRLQNEEHNRLKLELMEELIVGRDKPIIVLSHVAPAWYLLDRRPAPDPEDKALDAEQAAKRRDSVEKERQEVQERWRRLLRRFLFWDYRNQVDAKQLESNWGLVPVQDPFRNRRRELLLATAREECGDSEQLQKLSNDLVGAHLQDLSRNLFIDDLREKAEPYYRSLWTMCTEAEKVILVQLAEGNLVNPKNAGALKMLMKRGLVKHDPFFRLMNESFRRFVASDGCATEVRCLEHQAEASPWARMRGPLTLILLGVAAFFFVTQRDVFNVWMAFFSAVAAGLPTLFRVLGTAAPVPTKSAG